MKIAIAVQLCPRYHWTLTQAVRLLTHIHPIVEVDAGLMHFAVIAVWFAAIGSTVLIIFPLRMARTCVEEDLVVRSATDDVVELVV